MADCEVWDEGPPTTSLFHPDHAQFMPIGWPRPRDPVNRLPVPYIAQGPYEMGAVESLRSFLCVMDHRCQVCGDPLGDTCVVVAGPGSVLVIDGCGIHPAPCWPTAQRLCPQLAALHAAGTLRVWTMPTAELRTSTEHGSIGYLVPDTEPDAPASIEAATPPP